MENWSTQSTGELYTGPSDPFTIMETFNIRGNMKWSYGGVWKYYYPDGKIFAKISHLMGRPSGLVRRFMKMAVYLLEAS